jgi:hypothetical protein
MARRDVAGRSARGGEGIQALRPTGTRVAAGVGAIAVAAALAAYPPLLAGRAGELLAVPGALAAAAVVVALVTSWEPPALAAVAVLGGVYTGAMFLRGSELDSRAPLYAGLLVLLPELVAWSTQSRTRVETEPGVWRLRLAGVCFAVAASVAAAAAVVAVTVVETTGGLAWEAAGVLAAAAALGLVAALARRAA